jgi:TM2 domain-containing membrane protein YozV
MTEGQGWGVPPNMPPPPPSSNFVPVPPTGMPPPVPGTGASGQYIPSVPAHVPMRMTQHSSAYVRPDKSLGVAYLLWFFLGFLGIHHFYLGKVGRGVGYLLTCGWFLIGLLVDLFTLPSQVQRINGERKAGLR